jgi:predicted MFS family arabinose efflux permease
LQAGNALITSSGQLAGVVGAGIAGAVVAWLQPAGTLALDALTFVVSALTLLFMQNITTSAPKDVEHADAVVDISEPEVPPLTMGQLLRRSRLLQIMIVLMVFMNLGVGAAFEVALPAFLHNQLHAEASGYGFILAGFSIGAVIGAIVAGGLGKIPYRFLGSLASFLLMGVLTCLLPYMGNVWVGVLLMVAMGVLNGLGNVIILTVVQGQLPEHLMGRVMSVFAFANFGLYPFSVAIAGVLIPHYGTIPIFFANGLLLIVPCIWGCLQPSFWQRGDVQLMA